MRSLADLGGIVPKGNDWVGRELAKLRGEIEELRAARSGEATSVGHGGISIRDDGFLRMVDDNNTQIMYFGPDTDGTQIARLKREGGAYILYTGKAGGNSFWALTDSSNRILVSDDAVAGKGLARPWLPVFMSPTFVPSIPAAGATGTWCIDSAQIVTEVGLWEGRVSVSHPWIQVDGTWGHASGSGTVTYRLKINGNQVGTWNAATGVTASFGPFDVSSYIGADWASVQVTAQQTTGTGAVRCHVLGCYLTQTP